MEELLTQTLIIIEIMTTLKQIMDEIKNANTDINEDMINQLFEVIDRTSETMILFLTEIRICWWQPNIEKISRK